MKKSFRDVMFPCKHSNTGCTVTLAYTKKAEHEEACDFRPYTCPLAVVSCKWQGGLDQVVPHLMLSHKQIDILQGENMMFLATNFNLPGAVVWIVLQSCFNHHFMLVLDKREKFDGHQKFHAFVQFIGSHKEANNFEYSMTLNGHRRRFAWQAIPRSIREGISSAITNTDCLIFDTSLAQLFADNGKLGINVKISRT